MCVHLIISVCSWAVHEESVQEKPNSNHPSRARHKVEDQKLGFSRGGWTSSSSYGLQSAGEPEWRRNAKRPSVIKGVLESRLHQKHPPSDAPHVRPRHTNDQMVNYVIDTTRRSQLESFADDDLSLTEIPTIVRVTH